MIKSLIKSAEKGLEDFFDGLGGILFRLECKIFNIKIGQRRLPSWSMRGEIIVISSFEKASISFITVYPDEMDEIEQLLQWQTLCYPSSGLSPYHIWLESELI